MKHLIILFYVALAVSANAQTSSIQKSAPLSEADPETVGMSAERLNRIDFICKEHVETGNLPGIVALVARNGKIVFYEAYGMADNQSNRKMKKDDIFRIASQTKAITSTAVMMLWEEGKFRLDDPVSKYIPEFEEAKVLQTFRYADTSWTGGSVKTPITIRQLLTHTSGIGYGEIDRDERMRMICEKAGIKIAFTTEDVSIEENIKSRIPRRPPHSRIYDRTELLRQRRKKLLALFQM